jgi:hypothetical protein
VHLLNLLLEKLAILHRSEIPPVRHRIKPHGIKIRNDHLMPGGAQALLRRAEQRPVETARLGVRENNEHVHTVLTAADKTPAIMGRRLPDVERARQIETVWVPLDSMAWKKTRHAPGLHRTYSQEFSVGFIYPPLPHCLKNPQKNHSLAVDTAPLRRR